jgi:hypothetical protein
MRMRELPQVKSEEIKLGYVYYAYEFGYNCVWVCIGKCIGWKTQPYIFIEVYLKNYDGSIAEYDVNRVLTELNAGRFYVKDIFSVPECRNKRFSTFAEFGLVQEIGKLWDVNRIKGILTQLKLSGCSGYISEGVRNYGYIGDWTKREKLPCVTEFKVGLYYIKEPLAYVKQRERIISQKDSVWIYRGFTVSDKRYNWEEVNLSFLGYGEVLGYNVREHCVSRQYKDMVIFNEQEWKLIN